jgi:plastocyanin
MKRIAVWSGAALAAAMVLTIAACGGSDSSPTTPTNPGGTGGTIAATITIGTDGRVSPASVTVPLGSRVNFTNNHNRVHDMNSDPHPEHTQCPELNVGSLTVGQTKATQNLTTARRCGFHDHLDSGNASLQGSITIQ